MSIVSSLPFGLLLLGVTPAASSHYRYLVLIVKIIFSREGVNCPQITPPHYPAGCGITAVSLLICAADQRLFFYNINGPVFLIVDHNSRLRKNYPAECQKTGRSDRLVKLDRPSLYWPLDTRLRDGFHDQANIKLGGRGRCG